jgi:hypothetical protein
MALTRLVIFTLDNMVIMADDNGVVLYKLLTRSRNAEFTDREPLLPRCHPAPDVISKSLFLCTSFNMRWHDELCDTIIIGLAEETLLCDLSYCSRLVQD